MSGYRKEKRKLKSGLAKRPSASQMGELMSPAAPSVVPLRVQPVAFVLDALEGDVLRGLEEEGLWRECGESRAVLQLSREMVAGVGAINLGGEVGADALAAAGAVTRYLRQCVTPSVIPEGQADAFLAATSAMELKALVLELPIACRDVLARLCAHLIRVRDAPGTRLNTTPTVASMIASAILPDKVPQDAGAGAAGAAAACPTTAAAGAASGPSLVERMERKNAMVEILLDNHDVVFDDAFRAATRRAVMDLHTGLTPEPKEKHSEATKLRLMENAVAAIDAANARHADDVSPDSGRRAGEGAGPSAKDETSGDARARSATTSHATASNLSPPRVAAPSSGASGARRTLLGLSGSSHSSSSAALSVSSPALVLKHGRDGSRQALPREDKASRLLAARVAALEATVAAQGAIIARLEEALLHQQQQQQSGASTTSSGSDKSKKRIRRKESGGNGTAGNENVA